MVCLVNLSYKLAYYVYETDTQFNRFAVVIFHSFVKQMFKNSWRQTSMKRVQIHSISLSSILLQFYVILCCVAIICFPINWETPNIDIEAADEVNQKKFQAVVEHLAVRKFIF
jgi:hypothetical protein